MTDQLKEAIEELLRAWAELRSDSPVSELWDELRALDRACNPAFFATGQQKKEE